VYDFKRRALPARPRPVAQARAGQNEQRPARQQHQYSDQNRHTFLASSSDSKQTVSVSAPPVNRMMI